MTADIEKLSACRKSTHYLTLLLLVFLIIFSFLNTFRPHLFWKHFQFIDYPLHSAVEALGAIAAILMAFIPIDLMFTKPKPSFTFISFGFLSMGIWDLFHSFILVGNNFVFLHSVALLNGGFFFALIVIPWKSVVSKKKMAILSVIAIIMVVMAIISTLTSWVPSMINNGVFSQASKSINYVAGVFFAIATIKLIQVYLKNRNIGELILIFVATLSAIAGFIFQFSDVWTDCWWIWHSIRLISYVAVLSYMLWRVQKISSEKSLILEKINKQHLILKENEQKFRNLYNSDPAAIFIADQSTGLLTDVNPAAERLMGMTRNELIGFHQSKLHPEDIREEQVEKFKSLKIDPTKAIESEVLTKAGNRKPVEIRVSRIEIDNKPHIIGIFHDVSQLVEKQKQLKESEEKHRRSEEHTSELQSRGLISYAVFCLKKKKKQKQTHKHLITRYISAA